jgi:hypothetical protein
MVSDYRTGGTKKTQPQTVDISMVFILEKINLKIFEKCIDSQNWLW